MTGPGMGGRRDAVSLWGGRFAAAAAGSARPVVLAALLPLGLTAQDPQQVALLRGRIGVDPEPGSLLAAPARLTVSGLPLSDALARLAERSRVQIAFSPTLLPEGHRVECDCAALNTARALDRLLAGTDLGYVELGSQVVVVPRAPTEVPRPGGTIRGRVRTEVAVPIEDATARLLFAADSTVHRVTRTDRLGYFVFHDLDPGEYLVAAGRIGYAPHEKTITLAPGDAARLDLALPEQAIALEEVQVDGLGTRDRVRFRESAGETVQEMDRAQLRSIPGLAEADPIRTVGALPGVTAVSEVGASFNVRGGSADQNLILLDGVPIYNPFHMFGLFSIFSADMVRRTALRSGGFPAEYGGRTSSVLLIESDLGDEEFGVEAGVSLIASRVSVTGGLSEALMDGLGLVSARWRIGARRSYADILTKPFLRAPFPYYLQDRQAGLEAWTKGGSRLRVTTYSGRDVANLTHLERLGRDPEDSTPLPGRDVTWRWGNRAIGISWTRPRSNGGALDIRASYSRFGGTFNFSEFANPTAMSTVREHSLAADLEHGPGPKTRWKSGVLLHYLDYVGVGRGTPASFLLTDNSHGLGAAAYTQVDWTPNRNWLVEGGVRLDHWLSGPPPGRTGTISPRVAIKRFLGDGRWAARLSAGRYVQFLQSVRDESLPVSLDPWVLAGNSGASEVVSTQFQGGVEGFPGDGDEWFASAEAYYRGYRGLAMRNWSEDPGDPWDDVLRGAGRSYGADFVLRRNKGVTTGWVSVSLLKATRRFPVPETGLDPAPVIEYPSPFDRRLDVDLVVQRRLPWSVDGGLRWSLGTGLPHTRLVAYQANPRRIIDLRLGDTSETVVWLGPRNGERYPVRHRLDISLRRDFRKKWGLVTPYLNVINAYNRRNVVLYEYSPLGKRSVRRGLSLVPVLPTFGVEVSF